MIVVEQTHWPLVVVGSVPDTEPADDPALDEVTFSTADRLWVVLIVAGLGGRAREAQAAVVEWVCEHRALLNARVVRCAWVIEDDTLRSCAEAWQSLLGRRLFGADAATFPAFRPALQWLTGGRG
jgi:hypothetical protein